jgi:ferric iron reductase protein FhuF
MNLTHSPYRELLAGLAAEDDQRTAVALPALLQKRVLDQLLTRIHGAQALAEHKPVLVSQWSRHYFMHWLPAMLVSQLAHGWDLPLLLRDTGLVLDESGVPLAVRFFEAGEEGDAQASLEPWIASNLRPFIDALSAYGEVPPAVLWSNAGDCLESSVRRLQQMGLRNLAPAEGLMNQRKLADGRANPLYQPVRYLGDGRRERRHCCLARQITEMSPCADCPIV